MFGFSLHFFLCLSSKIPAKWKTSCLVLFPKHVSAGRGFNKLRSIALTSHVIKCFEKIILHHLSTQVSVALNPLKFAYRKCVGVEDAILFMLDNIVIWKPLPDM